MSKTDAENPQTGWVRQCAADHGAALQRYALSLCGGRADLAADAVQETFVRLLQADRAKVAGHALPWLLRVCRTRVLDLLRAQRHTIAEGEQVLAALPDTTLPTPAQAAATRDELGSVLACMAQLPPDQREVVRLKFLNDLSYKEIAAVTGHSVSNVGFLLHTALQRLRRELKPQEAAAG